MTKEEWKELLIEKITIKDQMEKYFDDQSNDFIKINAPSRMQVMGTASSDFDRTCNICGFVNKIQGLEYYIIQYCSKCGGKF